MAANARPTGVTVIAVIQGLEGVLLALIGLFALVGGSFFGGALLGAGGAALGAVIGILILVVAALVLFVAYGVWNLKSWAYWVAVVLAALGALGALGGLRSGGSWLSLILNLVVLYYALMDQQVKKAFGRA